MSDWGGNDSDDLGFVGSGDDDDDDDEQSLSNMFYKAKSKGISEDSYAEWQAIVAKECESHDSRNFSFKASKRIFRIELARGDSATAQATFKRLVSFIPFAEAKAVNKAFLSRKSNKNLLDVVCPKLNPVPCMRHRDAIEKTDAEIQFILFIHQTLLRAVETMRSTLLHVFKSCCLRLAKLLCCLGDVDAAIGMLVCPGGLLSLLRDESGNDIDSNANQLIELYAMLAPIHCDRQEWEQLKRVIQRVRTIERANPGTVGIIDIAVFRECEGMLCSKNKLWDEAFSRFHESYTLFCERDHARRHEQLIYCVLLGCFTVPLSHERGMALEMETLSEVTAIMQVNDTVKSVIELSLCFRAGNIHAFKAALRIKTALRGKDHDIITSQSFFSSMVDSLVTFMYSNLHHSSDPYFDELIGRLVCARRKRGWGEGRDDAHVVHEDTMCCIAADCHFIHQAEFFSHKSAKLIMRELLELPTSSPGPMLLQRGSEASLASVPLHVRCGLDAFIACQLTSNGDARRHISHVRMAHFIIDHIHRRRCRRMRETLVGLAIRN